MGLNFYHHDGLQPEMRAGIINEHGCKNINLSLQVRHFKQNQGTLPSTKELRYDTTAHYNESCAKLKYLLPEV